MKRQIVIAILLMGTWYNFGAYKKTSCYTNECCEPSAWKPTIASNAPQLTPQQAQQRAQATRDFLEELKRKEQNQLMQTKVDRLIRAALNGDLKQVNALIAERVDLDAMGGLGRDKAQKALVVAAEFGRDEIIKALLAAKADINTQDALGQTALMVAARDNHDTTVALLLNAKANTSLRDKLGKKTALMYASDRGNVNAVKLLLDAKADPMEQDSQGRTTLEIQKGKPAPQRNQQIIEILEKAGREALLGEDV
jgi:ankyrin repeat protein